MCMKKQLKAIFRSPLTLSKCHWHFFIFVCILCMSCTMGSPNNNEIINDTAQTYHDVSYSIEELCNPNKDTLLLWENGRFLCGNVSNRDYKLLLLHMRNQDSLSARDIETLYPTSVDEMNWFYSQLLSSDSLTHQEMCRIDTLMTLYADRDSLSCLPHFLNMYFLMDPRVIDREWMGDWNLNRVMYTVIPDNKQSFKKYYDTLNKKYEWLTREWNYAYYNF